MSKSSAGMASEGTFTIWVKGLALTWLGVSLLSIFPAILYGSAIFSFVALAGAVLVGVPSALFGTANSHSGKRRFRRLTIQLVVPALTLAFVSLSDKQIPENAMPLVRAIETFRNDTGSYPESLDALVPKHIAKLPDVRFSLFEPTLTYGINDGKPHLAIPSAMGDMFAQFEYDFETKTWMHRS